MSNAVFDIVGQTCPSSSDACSPSCPCLQTCSAPCLFRCSLQLSSSSFFQPMLPSFRHTEPPLLSSLSVNCPLLSPSLSLEFCVESTTVEFVLLPLIRLVLIFLPLSCSSAEWMNFFNCLSEEHLHCSAQWPCGLLPAIYYEIKIDGC